MNMMATGDHGSSIALHSASGSLRPYGEPNSSPKRWQIPYFVIFISVMASIGGILFGYDIGIISGALLQLKEVFHLDCFHQELVVSSILLGAFAASLVSGFLVDYFGRRNAIAVTAALFITGAVFLAFTVSMPMLLLGRLAVGFAVAVSTTAECTYIAEVSPAECRGLLVSLNEVGITLGFLLAYLLNFVFIHIEQGWKYMFGLAAIPALIQLISTAFLPMTTHFLILKGKTDQAKENLRRIRRCTEVDDEFEAIVQNISEDKSHKVCHLFGTQDNMRRRLIVGMALVIFQQVSGNANVLYYAPLIFQLVGFCSNAASMLASVGIGCFKVVTAIVAVSLVDRFGRRKFLLLGTTLMAVSVFVLGIVILTTPGFSVTLQCTDAHIPSSTNTTDIPSLLPANVTDADAQCSRFPGSTLIQKLLALITLMVYISAYQLSFGVVTWLILSEIFPTAVRGRAMAAATSVNWAANLLVSLTFLNFLEFAGIGVVFVTYSGICTAAAIFVFVCIPETKKKSLEEVDTIMKQRFRCPELKLCHWSHCYRRTETLTQEEDYLPMEGSNYF